MRMLKQILKPKLNDPTPAERFSLRFQDGVEIYEHEFVHRYTVSEPDESLEGPRLVVVENDQRQNSLITRTRAEIAGLSIFLSTAAEAK